METRWRLWATVQFVCSAKFWRMGVFWTFQLIYSYFILWWKSHSHPRRTQTQARGMPTRRPVCIVTGAASGLGAAAAHALAREGFNVVLAGLSIDLLSETMLEINQENPDSLVKAFEVDLCSFKSMLEFKRVLQQWLLDSDMHPSIQLLINNAGILATSQRFTAEGYDQMMGTNYIGAFVLTNLLLPLLKDSFVPSRIVNVTSFTHRCVSTIQVGVEPYFGSFSLLSKAYPCAQVYEYSKLYLVLFSYELHRQLRLVEESTKVSVMAADPGIVATNIMREVPSHLSTLAYTVVKFLGLLQSPQDGVNSVIDAALAPPEISGFYFFGGGGRAIPSSLLSYDTKLAEKLWNSSCKLFLPILSSYDKL